MLEAVRATVPGLERDVEGAHVSDTAKVWQSAELTGRIGFITSMSKNFCGGCNRIRLTADGNLKVRLFFHFFSLVFFFPLG